MARIGLIEIDYENEAPLPERVTELTRQINNRLRLISGAVDANDGSAVQWTETAIPTAGSEFAGRIIYHDRGQGALADNIYICIWNGTAWAWVLIA